MRRSPLFALAFAAVAACSGTTSLPTYEAATSAGGGGSSGAAGSGGSAGASGGAAKSGFHVTGGFLRDESGRAVLARGMNLAGSHKSPPYFGFQEAPDYALLHDQLGMSAIRFLVIWAAIEPQKGQYDDAYLDEVEKRIGWAEDAGLLVILDMHQDVFGEGFNGDGAPRWACDESRYASFKPQSSWFLNYLTPEVTACFDDFYASSELRGHYDEAWKRLAARVKGHANVVGFDVMNEPFWGSASTMTFEHDVLEPFYEEVVGAVREVAPGWVAFLEPASSRNVGFPTSLVPFSVPDVVYAPHAYEATAEQGMPFTQSGVSHFEKHIQDLQDDATYLGTALWIGEYGSLGDLPGLDLYMDAAYEGAGKVAAPNVYWAYDRSEGYGPWNTDGSEKPALLDAIVRPVPERVAGDPISFSHDRSTGLFTFAYRPDRTIAAPTIVSLPARAYPNGFSVDCGGCEQHVEANRLVITKPAEGDTVTVRVSPAS